MYQVLNAISITPVRGSGMKQQQEPRGNIDFRVNKTLFLSVDDNQALQCKQQ